MKGLFKFLVGIAVVFMIVLPIVSVVFYFYKTKCPHACRMEAEEEENTGEVEVFDKKKSAPHARGYFNLNRIREAEGIIRE